MILHVNTEKIHRIQELLALSIIHWCRQFKGRIRSLLQPGEGGGRGEVGGWEWEWVKG